MNCAYQQILINLKKVFLVKRTLNFQLRLNILLILLNALSLIFWILLPDELGLLSHSKYQIVTLFVINFLGLFLNSKIKNLFFELALLYATFFYILRIPFLLDNSVFSDLIIRKVSNLDIAENMWFLDICFIALYFAIFVLNPKIEKLRRLTLDESKFLLFFFSLMTNLNLIFSYAIDFFPAFNSSIINVFFSIFSLDVCLIIGCGLVTFQSRKMPKIYLAILYIGLFEIFLIALTSGSKQALFRIILGLLISDLVLKGPIVIRFLNFFEYIALLVGGVLSFYLALAFRFYTRKQIPLEAVMSKALELTDDLSKMFQGVMNRFGILDYFLEKSSYTAYGTYVSFGHYFKAIVDKLSPGFDFYGTVFMSRKLVDVYFGPSPNRSASEQITLFAEYKFLFGVYAPLFIFLSVLIFKLILNRLKNISSHYKFLFYIQLMNIWWAWNDSYGLDMLFVISIYQFLALVVIYKFWSMQLNIKSEKVK